MTISDDDIKNLDETIGRVLDIIMPDPGNGDDLASIEARKSRENLQQFRQLVSADTLKTMQLLGFNYKAAIGEPLTKLCAGWITSFGESKTAQLQNGKRKR